MERRDPGFALRGRGAAGASPVARGLGPGASAGPNVPREFVREAEIAADHSDPRRFALLYRLLVEADPRGAGGAVEPARSRHVSELARLVGQVREEEHKMHAFVRFRKVEAAELRCRRRRRRGDPRRLVSPGASHPAPGRAVLRAALPEHALVAADAGSCRRTGTGTSFASVPGRRAITPPPRTSSTGSSSPTTRACSTRRVRMSRPWGATCRSGFSSRYRRGRACALSRGKLRRGSRGCRSAIRRRTPPRALFCHGRAIARTWWPPPSVAAPAPSASERRKWCGARGRRTRRW